MVKLYIHSKKYTHYWDCATAWSGNMVAIGIMRNRPDVESVDVVDVETGEVLNHSVRG